MTSNQEREKELMKYAVEQLEMDLVSTDGDAPTSKKDFIKITKFRHKTRGESHEHYQQTLYKFKRGINNILTEKRNCRQLFVINAKRKDGGGLIFSTEEEVFYYRSLKSYRKHFRWIEREYKRQNNIAISNNAPNKTKQLARDTLLTLELIAATNCAQIKMLEKKLQKKFTKYVPQSKEIDLAQKQVPTPKKSKGSKP